MSDNLFEAREKLKRPEELIGVDIFAGAGGLSAGAELAGVSVKYAIEIWPSAAATFRRNHPHATVINRSITDIDPNAEIDCKKVFVVMGGPPCQGFSLSNLRDRNMDNPKNHLFEEFVRFVNDLKPDWFIFENVYGLKNMEKGKVIEVIADRFREIGYTVSRPTILWANNYGVPQKRNRLFLVGNRVGVEFEFPETTECNVTVNDAFSDLPSLGNGDMIDIADYTLDIDHCSEYARSMRAYSEHPMQNYVSRSNDLVIQRYQNIPQGGNWRNIPEELMQNYKDKQRCHSGIYKRLRSDSQSVVISNYRKMMLIHPTEDRGISVREAARLQSFPDSYIFEGPISHIQQQIGNAVPPLLAKAVINKILSYYE